MKTLDEIKDDAAIEILDRDNYEDGLRGVYRFEVKFDLVDEFVTAIATRFATEQNVQMKSDILELRLKLKYSLGFIESGQEPILGGSYVKKSGDNSSTAFKEKCETLLTKTAHYEN